MLKLSINSVDRWGPLVCSALVLYSIIVPSRDLKTVRDLRASFDSVRADNAQLRSQLLGVVKFVRDFDWDAVGGTPAVADAPVASALAGGVADGCLYTRVRGVDGVRRNSDTWLIGDPSPWGVIASAYPGGFSTNDGSRYSFWDIGREGAHDK